MTCIAYQGKAIGDKSSDNFYNKDATGNRTGQNEFLSFMSPILMFVAMFIFDVVIIYAMNVFDDMSPINEIII